MPPRNEPLPGVSARAGDSARAILENLFAFSPDAIFVSSANGEIQAANPRASDLFGYSHDEFLGMSVEQLVPQRFRGRHPAHRESYSAHPRARQMGAALNLFALRKDGTEFPVDIMLKPVQSESGLIVLSFLRDVTEQKAAQDELRRQDQLMRSIVEGVRDYAIYMLDRDGYVSTWSEGCERIQGYTAEEVL